MKKKKKNFPVHVKDLGTLPKEEIPLVDTHTEKKKGKYLEVM